MKTFRLLLAMIAMVAVAVSGNPAVADTAFDNPAVYTTAFTVNPAAVTQVAVDIAQNPAAVTQVAVIAKNAAQTPAPIFIS